MRKLSLLCSSLLLIPLLSSAYDFYGTIKHLGSGDYFVAVEDDYGHIYTGYAQESGYETLDINIRNDAGISYSGYATDNDDGSYDLDVKSNSSDDEGTGTLSEVY